MENKNLTRYYNLTTNSLVSATMELILVNIMLLYKSGRSITTLTTYWKKCQISTFTFRPYGPTNNMCKSKATFWINMVLFQSLICFKFNFFTFNLFGFWDHSCSALTYGCCLQSLAPWHVLASLFTASSSLRTSLAHHHTLGPNCKIPPKIRLKNSWNWLI